MALLGLLSLGQIVFLPGYLLLKTLRVGAGLVATCILSFALSLVINHFLVAGLVVAHAYRPAAIHAVFAVECILLLALDRRFLEMGLKEAFTALRQRTKSFLQAVGYVERTPGELIGCVRDRTLEDVHHCSQPVRITHHQTDTSVLSPSYAGPMAVRRTLLSAAVLVIGGFALSGIAEAGRIFQQWDAVVSWNRWAVDWAADRLPSTTSLYPQLLPTNLSLTYEFMRSSDVWIFAKGFQFLFCLMLLLAMLDMARIEGKFGYVPGVVMTYGLLVALLRFRMLGSGYADVPLAFFALAPVYVLMLARKTNDGEQRAKYLIAGAVLAAGAALTKQMGLHIAGVYPLLAWRFVLRGDVPDGLRKHLPELAKLSLILVLLVSPWYVYKFVEFQTGRDENNTAVLLTEPHEARGLQERVFHAGNMIVEAITPVGAIALVIAVAASLRDPVQRWFVGIFVVPLGLIWAIGFSYDLRNLSVIIPWIGSSAGIGMMQILSWATVRQRGDGKTPQEKMAQRENRQESTLFRPGFLRVKHGVLLFAIMLIAVSRCISDETLLRWQRQQQRLVGVRELNGQLYAYAAAHPNQAMVATDYQAMTWLPELGQRAVSCNCRDLAAFRRTFDRPEVRFALIRLPGAAADVRTFLLDQTVAQLVFKEHEFGFYEKGPCQPSTVAVVP